MLAQSFMTAADLGLTEIEKQSLVKVMGLLERQEINAKAFGMRQWKVVADDPDCGTTACICGWANLVTNGVAFPEVGEGNPHTTTRLLSARLNQKTKDLFGKNRLLWSVNREQAAIALRSYLTCGDARWDLALADQNSRAHENAARERP